MSIRPGLLASTSRSVFGSRVGYASVQWRRAASSSSTSKGISSAQEGTTQAADETQKKAEAQMRRMPTGIDMSNTYQSLVIDHMLIPRFEAKQLMSKGWYKYLYVLFRRFGADWKAARDMEDAGAYRYETGVFGSGIVKFFSPSARLAPLREELTDLYQRYNIAQAKGDMSTLRKISTGKARERARAAAKAIGDAKNEWSIVKTNAKPKFLSIRHQIPHVFAKEDASQVIIRFDYDQCLKLKNSTKTMRVAENVCFHRDLQNGSQWTIRDRVDYSPVSLDIL